MASKKKNLEKIDKEKVSKKKVKAENKEKKKEQPSVVTPKKKKNKGVTKIHLKPNVRTLIIFLILTTTLGLIFMNPLFTLALNLGILIIIAFCLLFNKIKRKWIRVIFNLFAILILLGAIGGVVGVVWFINYIKTNAPEFTEDAFNMSQTSVVYAADGSQIAELGTEKREIIKYDQMNEAIVDSLIATEDSRFFQHNGFDAPRFIIASIKQLLLKQEDAGGASTLTMQVAKTHYQQDKANVTKGFAGIARKFTDIYMAVFKIERNYSKEEIIEYYLNDHFLGNNSYGVEQAAETYFNKRAQDLNLSEAALIIGLYQAPGAYNPFLYPEKAEARRSEVLYLLKRHGYITEEEREIADSISVQSLLNPPSKETAYYSYLVTVIEEAKNKYGVNPNTTSVLVYTNMDKHHQTVMDDAMAGRSYAWANDEAQAGLSVVDVHSGKVVAIAAGRNQDGGLNFNYATQTKRQIGSSAKPIFDYGPGIEFNNWSTYKLFDDSRYYYSSGQEIHDSDRQYLGILTLRKALSLSRNIPALKAFQQVNNSQSFEFAQSLGISLEEESIKGHYLHEAYSIGSFNGSNPWEMAAAYAAFANGGYYYEPYTINKIVFRDTGEVITYESEKKRVMSDSTAFMITDVLKDAVVNGLSGAAEIKGVNVAAKTGTTNLTSSIIYKYGYGANAVNDAWVVGYDPEYSIAMWYGYEPLSKTYYTNNDTAYTIRKNLWSATAGNIFKRNGQDFQVPGSVVKVGVEMSNDVNAEPKLASEFTPQDQIIYEWFKRGTEPTEVSTRYMRLGSVPDFSVSYEPGKNRVNMSWGRVGTSMTVDASYGELGYRIYKDGREIGFTTNNVYSIENVTEPNGRYSIICGYRNNRENDSAEVSRDLNYVDMSVYDSKLLASPSKTYSVGESLVAQDNNPSAADVEVTKKGNKVQANVSISIVNSKGEAVSSVTTDEADSFTITYKISFEAYSKEYKRTITVKGSSSSGGSGSSGSGDSGGSSGSGSGGSGTGDAGEPVTEPDNNP
jgi:penicillin-binding protein 1A